MLSPDEKKAVRVDNPIAHLGEFPANTRKIEPMHVRAAQWRLLDAIAVAVMNIIADCGDPPTQDLFDVGMMIADRSAELRHVIKYGKANANRKAGVIECTEGYAHGFDDIIHRRR